MNLRAQSPVSAQGEEPIAIVGLAGIFPGAANAGQFWRNILDRIDAVGDAPEDWGGGPHLDPDSDENDRIYTNRGGFLRDLAVFDPLRHGVMPNSIDGGEPDQFLALEVAADAVEDAGFDQRPVPGDRVAVILGRGTYINRGFTTVVQHGVMADRVLDILRRLHPDTTADELARIKRELKASLPPFNAETVSALVPNLVTGRISNRLDFRGTNYMIDAACASSLIALERGVADLRAGRCDMALVGGVHASTPPPIYMIFCQLEALSRQGRIRPFSAEADGTLLAEGVGILCLKRLSDAEAAGDRIYALVRAVGVASDGRGMGILAPRLEGETLALERAYAEAGVEPDTVGLIEAHGTATAVGDATEIAALGRIMGPRRGSPRCALGSVKSMIGHCLPASGSAGLIKTALALHHRVLPPTLLERPNPDLGIEDTPLYLNTEARPWIHGASIPRRAGVNAFGFGGINAHAVLEEYVGAPEPSPNLSRPSEAILLDASDPQTLLAAAGSLSKALRHSPDAFAALARDCANALGHGSWRLAVVARHAAEAADRLDRASELIAAGKTRARDSRGIFLNSEPLAMRGGKLAFVFPGEGSQHVGMLQELMLHQPGMRRWFDIVDAAFADHSRDLLPSQVIFPPPGADAADAQGLWRMDIGPEAIFAANQAVATLYARLGLSPDMLAGHSTGEYSALFAAGCTRREDPTELQAEMRALNSLYEQMATGGRIAEGTLVAMGAVDGAALEARLAGQDGLYLAMDNCPNQKVVAAVGPEAVLAAQRIAADLGALGDVLPFARAYHSPAFAGFGSVLRQFLAGLRVEAPERPIYSCLSAAPFPDDPEAIRDLAAGQWSGRVRFSETILRMHADGARIFVECGPRNTLTSFVNDILRDKPHLAVAVDTPGRAGLVQLHHFVAQLAVAGLCPRADGFCAPHDETAPATASVPRRPKVLKMGMQPMALPEDFVPRSAPARATPDKVEAVVAPAAPAAPANSASPRPPVRPAPAPISASVSAPVPVAAPSPAPGAMAAYFDTMERFMETERDILTACFARRPSRAAPSAVATHRPSIHEPPPAVAQGRPGRFMMLGELRRASDGASLSTRIDIDIARAPYLADHSFGRGVSALDPTLGGLSVVPLTFSMEALAEAAAALCPELVVTGMEEVRASRWLSLEAGRLALEATAERRPSTGMETRVRVRLRAADGPALRPILVEADVLLAAERAPAPPAPECDPGPRRGAPWTQEDIYGRIMFHGPRLQAVASMEVAGRDGVEGELLGLPNDALLDGAFPPVFETDAVTLDAVGQLVGVWSAEMLDDAFHIFPFRVERLEIFRDPLPPGERARCRGRIALVGADEMRSDLDVVCADGRLQCRVEGWWDKRFGLPDRFFRARLDPQRNPVSRLIELPGLPGLRLALLADLRDEFLDGSGGIWAKVLAHLALSRAERSEWIGLAGAVAKRRLDWLRGRSAAKDALRALAGRPCHAADLPIQADPASGQPRVDPQVWPAGGPVPHISISHSTGVAVAVAADPAAYAAVGIDIERVAPRQGAFLETAFCASEREAIASVAEGPARDLLVTRMWCSREALGKAMGLGLADLLARFEVVASDDAGATLLDRSDRAAYPVRFLPAMPPGLVGALAISTT